MNLVKGQVFNKLLIQTVKLQSVQNINKFKLTTVKLFIFKKFLQKVNSQFFNKLIQPLKFVSVCVAFSIQSLNEKEIIKIADDLHSQNKYDDQEKLLNKPELLERSNLKHEFKWRLARAKYYQIKEKKRNSNELENIRDLVLTALEDDPECGAAHKWASILIDAAAANIGIEERIKKLFTVKDHMLKAIHFSPKDPTSLYILAEWHYSCYNVSWAERQIAKLIFGTLPEPDLEEALTCLKKAEEMQPCYYAKSLVLMSKTLIALKRESDLARQSLDKVLTNFQNSTKIDDIEAIKEAKEILKKMEKKGLPAFAKTAPIN